jgi:uncharacterized protein (TIGR02118 family)
MIFSNSLERQRDDIDLDEFRRHWLHPHGPMTAGLPGTRRYIQNHVVFTRGTNALARLLRIQGVAQLGYDSLAARNAAYDSPELVKACDADTPLFVGAVTRVVTECTDPFPADEKELSKAIVLVPRLSQPKQTPASVLEQLEGVRHCAGHRIIEQAGPPKGKVPALGLEVDLLLELWFANDDDLVRCCENNEAKRNNIAIFHIKPYFFI